MLIYDGDCGFCTSAARWITRIVPAAPDAQPYQFLDLDQYGLTEDDCAERVWLVTPTTQYGGHLAVAALLRHQPTSPWRTLGWLATVPPWSWTAAAAYALVARYRYLLPGGTPACQIKK